MSFKSIVAVMVFLVLTSVLTGCNFKQENAFLYRGPAPTIKRLNELKAMGIKTIVSVRNNPNPKKAAYAEKIGLKWMTVKTSVMRSPKEEDIRKFINIVSNPANQPVYVCCVGGRDRSVFYVTAYKIAVEGADPEEAVAHMEGSTWHKLWPGFRYYVDILKAGAKDKYGWKPEVVEATETGPFEQKTTPLALPSSSSI
ncbi:MAG: hypothetical protein C0469_14775 [Cyanobacteria bacterium DS2.3.42]|nr:hypothetical protein [Cyanobacteria bacterium DS2.3.42]